MDKSIKLQFKIKWILPSLIWCTSLESPGMSGRRQRWPVEGTYTSADTPDLLDSPPDITNPEYQPPYNVNNTNTSVMNTPNTDNHLFTLICHQVTKRETVRFFTWNCIWELKRRGWEKDCQGKGHLETDWNYSIQFLFKFSFGHSWRKVLDWVSICAI